MSETLLLRAVPSPSAIGVSGSLSAQCLLALAEQLRNSLSVVEGLRMALGFHHVPVMAQEVCSFLESVPEGTILDATIGGGGHAEAILEHLPRARIVGLDVDEDAIEVARSRLERFGDRVVLVQENFSAVSSVCEGLGVGGLSGALFDLGVSSWQLEQAERGFSYLHTGPIDMRMDRRLRRSAADIVNEASERDLVEILRRGGEDRHPVAIARAIVRARPLFDTASLAAAVASAVPGRQRRGGHPARRTFQALRIEVNQELEVLVEGLEAAWNLLVPGGRMIVLSYHSGEDRIVKQFFKSLASPSSGAPAKLLTKRALKASAEERISNPRSRSVRLRALEKTVVDVSEGEARVP